MSLEDLQARMRELRNEQLRTSCPRRKLMIRAEKQYVQRQIDDLNGKDYRLAGIGSKRKTK